MKHYSGPFFQIGSLVLGVRTKNVGIVYKIIKRSSWGYWYYVKWFNKRIDMSPFSVLPSELESI